MHDSRTPLSRPLEPQAKAIVVGASSGIGAALVHELAKQGYHVAALARREAELEALCRDVNQATGRDSVHTYVHDVTDTDAVPALFAEITHALGGLDLIIYVAGVQPAVAANEYNFEKDQQMIQVNLLGAVAWLNEAAMRFERGRAGHIAAISSIAGDRGRRAFPGYHTSKGALNIYLESLRNRLTVRGVTVTTLKLGFVKTRLLDNAPKTFWVISPAEAARQILQAIHQRKQVVYIPRRWQLMGLVIRAMPSFIFRRLNI